MNYVSSVLHDFDKDNSHVESHNSEVNAIVMQRRLNYSSSHPSCGALKYPF